MDRSSEIRESPRTRRARITPEQVGLALHPGARRVPGLRREEGVQLSAVNFDHYVRLERGRIQGVSRNRHTKTGSLRTVFRRHAA